MPLMLLAGYGKEVWQALSKNADFDVTFRIEDNEDQPVARAKCSGWIYQEHSRNHGYGYSCYSDTNGNIRLKGKCSEWFRVNIQKEGYYHSQMEIKYPRRDVSPAVSDGKWQPFGECRTIVLKRIKNPLAVKIFDSVECRHNIPAFGQWLPFDMECSDWLSPYGKGLHDDVLLRFEKKETGKWYEFSFSMEACFTNHPYAGVYCRSMDEFSDLKTAYEADTNANFNAFYTFSIESQPGKRVIEKGLARDSYLVFRTRTRVDKQGRLIGAHYGKYCRGWRSDSKQMLFGEGCFNQVENDPNIEGDLIVKYAIKNYKARK